MTNLLMRIFQHRLTQAWPSVQRGLLESQQCVHLQTLAKSSMRTPETECRTQYRHRPVFSVSRSHSHHVPLWATCRQGPERAQESPQLGGVQIGGWPRQQKAAGI